MVIGYEALVRKHQLACLKHFRTSEISTRVKGQQPGAERDEQEVRLFEPRYRPEDTLCGQLEFALKHEGISLEILNALFKKVDAAPDLHKWLERSPASIYARKAAFLYEWLTGRKLENTRIPNAAYANLLDPDQYVVLTTPTRHQRYRINDNLLGTREFCPLVRRTELIASYEKQNIEDQVRTIVNAHADDVIGRAVSFLYLKETQSSFQIEREKPSPEKARRFVELLASAGRLGELTEQKLIELQNAIIDPRYREFAYRPIQNWVGDELGEYRLHVEFIPPAPRDLPSLMRGLLQLVSRTQRNTSDAVATTAAAAFGFVYFHPFNDGNGRIHRFLIHYMLEQNGFTPPDMIIPVSAAMLATEKEYRRALNTFSKQLMRQLKFRYAAGQIDVQNNDADYYRYFDATAQTEYLYASINRAVSVDLREEIEYLIAFEKARASIDEELDLPAKDRSLLIRVIVENGGHLSNRKRQDLFEQLSDDEVARVEAIVGEAFDQYLSARNQKIAP